MQKFDSWEAAGFPQGPPKNARKYNWNELIDGSIWNAEQYEDFTCTTESFHNQIRNQARSRNLKAHIETRGTTVRFQFFKG